MTTASIIQLLDLHGDDLIVGERSTSRIALILTAETGLPIQASQLTSLKLSLSLRDDTSLPALGINGVLGVDILNTGRGTIGNEKTVIAGSLTADYAVRLRIANHGYSSGDLVAVRNVIGLRGANGDWPITVIDNDWIELQASLGSGTWSSGGGVVKGLHLTLLPADNVIVDPTGIAIGETEWHTATIVAVYNTTSQFPMEVQYQVANLGLII